MGYLKGLSSLMIFDWRVNLKYKFGNRMFWAEGCIRGSSSKAHPVAIMDRIAQTRSGSTDAKMLVLQKKPGAHVDAINMRPRF